MANELMACDKNMNVPRYYLDKECGKAAQIMTGLLTYYQYNTKVMRRQ